MDSSPIAAKQKKDLPEAKSRRESLGSCFRGDSEKSQFFYPTVQRRKDGCLHRRIAIELSLLRIGVRARGGSFKSSQYSSSHQTREADRYAALRFIVFTDQISCRISMLLLRLASVRLTVVSGRAYPLRLQLQRIVNILWMGMVAYGRCSLWWSSSAEKLYVQLLVVLVKESNDRFSPFHWANSAIVCLPDDCALAFLLSMAKFVCLTKNHKIYYPSILLYNFIGSEEFSVHAEIFGARRWKLSPADPIRESKLRNAVGWEHLKTPCMFRSLLKMPMNTCVI
uniref:Uncharacterized protein n=1 Tax=Ditylenchus dipsaci TaxID=166011 RepID=A0A915DBA6_9BILA